MFPIGDTVGTDVSLSDFLGSAFGDPGGAGEADVAEGGSPPAPAEVPGQPTPIAPPAQAESPDASDAESPADPESPADVEESAAPPEDDPFKDARPFTYTVDGHEKTYDGIKVLGDDGAVIEPDAMADLGRRLADADRLVETNQRQYQTLQTLDRYTQWEIPDGNTTRAVSGVDGIVAMRTRLAEQAGEGAILRAAIQDPAFLATLIQGVDEKGALVVSPMALTNLDAYMTAARLQYANAVRQQMDGWRAEQGASTAAPNYTQQAPQMVEEAAHRVQATSLTGEDKAFLQQQLLSGGYLRTATADDVRQWPSLRVGQAFIHPAFDALVQRESARRAEMGKAAQVSQAAAQTNAKRLQAAARTTKPSAPPPPVKPKAENASDAKHEWEARMLRSANRAASTTP